MRIIAKTGQRTLRPAQEAVRLCKVLGSNAPLAEALYTCAAIGRYVNVAFGADPSQHTKYAGDAGELFRKAGNEPGECASQLLLAEIYTDQGNASKAKESANKA